jgi:hypothetical protein
LIAFGAANFLPPPLLIGGETFLARGANKRDRHDVASKDLGNGQDVRGIVLARDQDKITSIAAVVNAGRK